MSNAGAVVAAIRLRKEREIVAFLREHGALSGATAVQLGPQNLIGKSALRALMRGGAVVAADNGAHYLDNDAYEVFRARRTSRIWIVIALALLGVVAVHFVNTLKP